MRNERKAELLHVPAYYSDESDESNPYKLNNIKQKRVKRLQNSEDLQEIMKTLYITSDDFHHIAGFEENERFVDAFEMLTTALQNRNKQVNELTLQYNKQSEMTEMLMAKLEELQEKTDKQADELQRIKENKKKIDFDFDKISEISFIKKKKKKKMTELEQIAEELGEQPCEDFDVQTCNYSNFEKLLRRGMK